MKTFKVCPKCHNPMLNISLKNSWRLSCANTLGHEIVAQTIPDQDLEIMWMEIALDMLAHKDQRTYASWNFVSKKLFIARGDSISRRVSQSSRLLELPFFEPNVEDFDKLIKKFCLYVTFS